MSNPKAPPATPVFTVDDLARARAGLADGARAAAVAKQHAAGKLTARERIATLTDAQSFYEVGAFVEPKRSTSDTENLHAPADGVITGFARIEGRPGWVHPYRLMPGHPLPATA